MSDLGKWRWLIKEVNHSRTRYAIGSRGIVRKLKCKGCLARLVTGNDVELHAINITCTSDEGL